MIWSNVTVAGVTFYILSFILFYIEWMDFVRTMTRTLMAVFGVKERTSRGYAIVIAALRFMYDRNEEYFLSRNHPWTEFMEVSNAYSK